MSKQTPTGPSFENRLKLMNLGSAGACAASSGWMMLFAVGAQVGELEITGDPVFTGDVGMVVGTGHGPSKPSNLHRDFGTLESWLSLDGIIDEVKVYNQPMNAGGFWRGTRYSPAWVSGNGLWMADQSVEAWNNEQGCIERLEGTNLVLWLKLDTVSPVRIRLIPTP